MIPLMLGLGSAAIFLIGAIAVYGTQVLAGSVWVTMVFLGLVGSGVGVFLLNRHAPCWLCRLQQRHRLIDDLCSSDGPGGR
jgi:hypothetical protein